MDYLLYKFLSLCLLLSQKTFSVSINEKEHLVEDTLTPYSNQHGSKFHHRTIHECHQQKYGSAPHILYAAHKSPNTSLPFIKVKRFVRNVKSSLFHRTIRGHYITISNPLETMSVLEPDQLGGCALNIRQTVAETSKKHQCLVAINAGYFDTKKGNCLGNVISDGRKAHDSNGVQNAHFGLTNDGQIFTGYVSQENYTSGYLKQLVGGVIWILRNGTGFVNASKAVECEDTEETGPMENFVSILSARTAVGHDANGNVIFVQVDGKSNIDGVNLYDMEVLLKELGLVNAINLDGGGSSTLVVNRTTVNYPYDSCPDDEFSCDRKVSTILCVHSPYCDPINCSNHGSCSMGKCMCEKNWLPPHCDKLFCGISNCSGNGVCLSDGCLCHPGYHGEECNQTCPVGWFGSMCSKRCNCLNAVNCDPITGSCTCRNGFTGDQCLQSCSVGYFGANCQFKCQCDNSYCDPENGACDILYNNSIHSHAKCFAQHLVKNQYLDENNANLQRKWIITMIILGVLTAICIASCLLISCLTCSCYCQNKQLLCFKKTKHSQKKPLLQIPSGYLSDSLSDSETLPMNNFRGK